MQTVALKTDSILDILNTREKLTATEIAERLSVFPNAVIKKLILLENFNKIKQLNGYWYCNVVTIKKLTYTAITDLIELWGPLSFAEIAALMKFSSPEIKTRLREALSRQLLDINSIGKYYIVGSEQV